MYDVCVDMKSQDGVTNLLKTQFNTLNADDVDASSTTRIRFLRRASTHRRQPVVICLPIPIIPAYHKLKNNHDITTRYVQKNF